MSYYPAVVTLPANFQLRFTPHEEPSLEVPYELKNFYTDEVWAKRIPALTRKASRYYRKSLEWIWFIISFSALIALPIALYYVALHNLPEDDEDKKDDDDHHHWWHWNGFNRVWKARLISLATWVALMILTFIPMHMWKSKGKKEVNAMLEQWENEDRAVLPPGRPYPVLRMRQPGVLNGAIKIKVSVPSGPAPGTSSMFNPGAPVPPYLANPPSDPGAAAYYNNNQQPPVSGGQWGPPSAGYGAGFGNQSAAYGQNGPNGPYGQNGQSGQPPYGQAQGQGQGAVPLYNQRNEQTAGYNAYPVPQPHPNPHNEKAENPFEDVKV